VQRFFQNDNAHQETTMKTKKRTKKSIMNNNAILMQLQSQIKAYGWMAGWMDDVNSIGFGMLMDDSGPDQEGHLPRFFGSSKEPVKPNTFKVTHQTFN